MPPLPEYNRALQSSRQCRRLSTRRGIIKFTSPLPLSALGRYQLPCYPCPNTFVLHTPPNNAAGYPRGGASSNSYHLSLPLSAFVGINCRGWSISDKNIYVFSPGVNNNGIVDSLSYYTQFLDRTKVDSVVVAVILHTGYVRQVDTKVGSALNVDCGAGTCIPTYICQGVSGPSP